jgi:hypothetical protein
VIELQVATTKEVPLVEVILLKSCAAQPTPLVLTFWTSHVVAADIGNLGDSRLAHFAVNHVAFSLCPFSVV